MKSAIRAALLGVVMCAAATGAQAAPIVYLGQIGNGDTVAGINTQNPSSVTNPVGADYWSFTATAGDLVTINGDRQAGHYDMAFWIYSGLFADTNDFGGAFGSGEVAFGDDQDPPNIAGPFGDPRVSFIAPVTGSYTIAVTNFLSSAGPPNPYTLTAQGVPEPGTLLLLGTGLVGLVRARRRVR